MSAVYDIYQKKYYFNRFNLNTSITFRVDVRETNLQVQAHSDLSAKAKDAVFRYRYQIEEYLRQHPAFREASGPIQIFASAPEIVRFSDVSSRTVGLPPMACMSGAMADFVARDLLDDSSDIVVASGGDAFIKCSTPVDVELFALGSPLNEKITLALPAFKRPLGISTYAPGKGLHSVTVLSRSACWASGFSTDIGNRLLKGESPDSVLDRVAGYDDIGGIIIISGKKLVVGGDFAIKSKNGTRP